MKQYAAHFPKAAQGLFASVGPLSSAVKNNRGDFTGNTMPSAGTLKGHLNIAAREPYLRGCKTRVFRQVGSSAAVIYPLETVPPSSESKRTGFLWES